MLYKKSVTNWLQNSKHCILNYSKTSKAISNNRLQGVIQGENSRAAGTSPAVGLKLCQLSDRGLTWAKTQQSTEGQYRKRYRQLPQHEAKPNSEEITISVSAAQPCIDGHVRKVVYENTLCRRSELTGSRAG